MGNIHFPVCFYLLLKWASSRSGSGLKSCSVPLDLLASANKKLKGSSITMTTEVSVVLPWNRGQICPERILLQEHNTFWQEKIVQENHKGTCIAYKQLHNCWVTVLYNRTNFLNFTLPFHGYKDCHHIRLIIISPPTPKNKIHLHFSNIIHNFLFERELQACKGMHWKGCTDFAHHRVP